jgi:hypothetical protein
MLIPGQTFRALKEKEEKQYGEYRTRHLVLGTWDGLYEREEFKAYENKFY